MSLDKPIEQITQADLQALIQNQVSERKTIEYKLSLPAAADADPKEFLADVSSFANAAGGHLIYGMREEGGVPIELCGLDPVAVRVRHLGGPVQAVIGEALPAEGRVGGVVIGIADLEHPAGRVIDGLDAPRSGGVIDTIVVPLDPA